MSVTDDPTDYAQPYEGYGRVWGYSCGGQIETPRTYALNLWNEAMTAIVNPIGVPVTELSDTDDYQSAISHGTSATTTVGGSYFICINPAAFGPMAAVKSRSDGFVGAIRDCKPRPGQHVRIPGETAYNNLQQGNEEVEVLANHWDPFFNNIAGKYGLSEANLRADFEASS